MKTRGFIPLILSLLIVASACGGSSATTTTASSTTTIATIDESTTTTSASTTTAEPVSLFPVTVEGDSGPVTIEEMPTRIVSLSPTATETLFAVGAGDQVVAVDEFSSYPADAPVTDLSGYTPNVEAILEYSPDLLVITMSPNDLQAAVEAVGIPVLLLGTATSLESAYDQIATLGLASGHGDEAAAVIADMQDRIAALTESLPTSETPLTYYHELDTFYYSVTSQTFVGQMYGLLGLVNIADDADPDGYGFPQLTEEYIINANPDFIFLADAECCGQSLETVAARPGWDAMQAVTNGRVIPIDADLASRWGPRTPDFIEAIAAVLMGADIAQ